MLSILQRYISKSYLSAWFLGVLVLSFVLSIGLLVKATQLVVKGLPANYIFNFLAVSLPESFAITIPLASLVSALLLFGRLSADGEISAMRSCGINIWRILTPLIFFGILLTALSVYVNSEVAPRGSIKRHNLLNVTTHTKDLIKLLEPGHFIHDFGGVDLWFESREGESLKNVIIREKTQRGYTRETRCEEATFEMVDDNLLLDMNMVRISPFSENQPGTATADHLRYTFANAVQRRPFRYKVGDYPSKRLLERISAFDQACATIQPSLLSSTNSVSTNALPSLSAAFEDYERDRTLESAATKQHKNVALLTPAEQQTALLEASSVIRSQLLTEFNRRLAMGMAPIAFILLGMPLGIRTSRRESNIGIAISLGIMLLYYAFMIAGKSLAKHPDLFPHIIIWTPTVICIVLAAILIRRNQ